MTHQGTWGCYYIKQTPLHVASEKVNFKIVKYLVEKGANIQAKTDEGQTPLDLAFRRRIVNFLKDSGAKKGNLSELEPESESDSESKSESESDSESEPESEPES